MNDEPQSQLLLYQTEDGKTRLEVRLENETVWLTQNQMAELFQTSIPNVSMHIRNIFAEGELQPGSVVKEFLTTAADGKNYQTKFYNLDVIISVGYRVKSHRGTQFRIWATQRLREYIVKGFALDDERFKRAGAGITSRNCWPASATSGRRRRFSGARCWRFTQRVLTTTRAKRRRRFSSLRCRTKCTGRRMDIRRRRSSTSGRTRPGRTWD